MACFIYVFVFLYLSWIPLYTIIPWFYNLNTPDTTQVLDDLYLYGLVLPYILYDCVYTGLSIYRLYYFINIIPMDSSNGIQRKSYLTILTIKAIIHNIISAASILADNYWDLYGGIFYNMCTMISLHLLFNWKIEAYLPKLYRDHIAPSSNGDIPVGSSARKSSSGHHFSATSLIKEGKGVGHDSKKNISLFKLSMASTHSQIDRHSSYPNHTRNAPTLELKKGAEIVPKRGSGLSYLQHNVNIVQVKPRMDVYSSSDDRLMT